MTHTELDFDRPAVTMTRRDDPDTSHEAATKMVESGRLRRNQLIVLRAVCDHPASTYAELAEYANATLPPAERIKQNEPARRLPELETAGLVETRTNEDGKAVSRECMVQHTKCRPWWPTELGKRCAQDLGGGLTLYTMTKEPN